jgi:hypothetical protein
MGFHCACVQFVWFIVREITQKFVQPRNTGFVVEGKKRVAKVNPIPEESPAIKKVFPKCFFLAVKQKFLCI